MSSLKATTGGALFDVIGGHGAQLVVLGRVAHDLDERALDGLGAGLGDGGALVGGGALAAVVHADEGVAGGEVAHAHGLELEGREGGDGDRRGVADGESEGAGRVGAQPAVRVGPLRGAVVEVGLDEIEDLTPLDSGRHMTRCWVYAPMPIMWTTETQGRGSS